MDSHYTIMIAEDEEMILSSLNRHILACHLGFEVIGKAQDGQELLNLLKIQVPHVVFTDIHMPNISGLEIIQHIHKEYPDVLKVIVSGYDNFEYAKSAIHANVQDYLLKPVLKDDMHATLSKLRILLDKQYKKLLEDNIDENNVHTIDETITLAAEYLRNNFTKDISIHVLAANFHFNTAYFSRNFTKKMGKSPSKYITSLRLNKAKHLLSNCPKLTVGEISKMVGYTDQAYFSRIFKLVCGVTPADFRNK